MEIIPYKLQDAPAVAKFFREIFTELGWKERPSDYMDQPQLLFCLPDGGALLLIKDGGEVIGTAGIIMLNEIEALIKRFYLQAKSRGSGIAKDLLDELETKAKSLGAQRFILDVSKTNLRAIRFYQKTGFEPTTVTPQPGWPESYDSEGYLYFYKNLL